MRNLLQNTNRPRNQSGSTVILSIIVIIVLAMFVSAALDYTMQSLRFSQRSNAQAQALDAATGALDNAFVQWRQGCRSQENVPMASGSISSFLSNPSYSSILTSGSNGAGFLSGTGAVSVALYALNGGVPVSEGILSSSSAVPIPTYAEGPNMPTYSYLAQATVNYQTLVGGIGAHGINSLTVSRVFQKVTSSPWLYALFYNDNLEINPGSPMAITGQVQTNGNLYTGGDDSGNELTFENTVSYAGTWDSAGQWAPTDSDHSGTPAGPDYTLEPSAGPEQTPENAATLTTASTNPNQADGYHEIIDAPNSAYSDPLASTNAQDPSERIYNQAGVVIQITGNTVDIYDSSGNLCTSKSTGTDLGIYQTFSAAVTTGVSLKDYREGTTLSIDQLDISKISTALNTSGTAANALAGTGCNIVYIYNTGYNKVSGAVAPDNQTGGAAVGIELINGYNMPTGGLTVASENPVYIMGDYNTAATKSANMTNVLSNQSSSNDTEPYASGYTPQPCAVMADAVTILSNAWSNSVTTSMPTASNTTINTAILSGIVTSARSGSGQTFNYSGGAENFLRLLENWSGKLLTYYGSMDEMFNSKQATGVWKTTGGYYNAPTRQWYFNIGFYTSPPPGTFKAISYVRSRWYTQ